MQDAEVVKKKPGNVAHFGLPWDLRGKEAQELRALAVGRVVEGGESCRKVAKELGLDSNVLRGWVTKARADCLVPTVSRPDYKVPMASEEAIKNFLIDQALSVAPTLARLRKSAARTLGQAHEAFQLIIQHSTVLLKRGFEIVEVETPDGIVNVPKLLGYQEIKGLAGALKSSAPELAALHGWSYGTYRPDRLSKTQDLHQHNHLHLSSKGGKASGPKGSKPAAIIKDVQEAVDCHYTTTGEDLTGSQARLLESSEE